MGKLLLLFGLVLLLDGCITTGPPDNVDLGEIKTIRDVEGNYQNRGEGEPGTRPIYLSAQIWPNIVKMDHAAVETIEVKVVNDNTLVVKALRKDGVEKEDTFIEGKNFELHSGRIRLQQGVGFMGLKSGEPVVGPNFGRVELGLDKKGHGKLRTQGGFVGLVYMVIPLAIGISEEVRFVRIDKATP